MENDTEEDREGSGKGTYGMFSTTEVYGDKQFK